MADAMILTLDDEGNEDGMEEVPDWSIFQKASKTPHAAFIPKRGEKDFEPISSLADRQTNALQRSRDAMYAALDAGNVRQHSSKAHNEAVWHPHLSRASINRTHGVHFLTMAHYCSARARIELWPEEVLYLVERGALECFTEQGVPMSAQEAFAHMLGTEQLSMERYQIYAYLKRLGYSVQRASHGYRPPEALSPTTRSSLLDRLGHRLAQWYTYMILHPTLGVLSRLRLCDHPLRITCASIGGHVRRLLPLTTRNRSLLSDVRWTTYKQAFESLRVVPAGHSLSLFENNKKKTEPENPFDVFWHVYKPITKYKKSQPCAPDFYLSVVNAEETDVPTISQLAQVFDTLPIPSSNHKQASQSQQQSWTASLQSTWLKLGSWLRPLQKPKYPTRKRQPYGDLKRGEKTLIVAIVQSGTSSFLRFSSTDFASRPWL